jgi:parallel beta-helix repeat protein
MVLSWRRLATDPAKATRGRRRFREGHMHIFRFLFIAIATLAAFGGASKPAAAAESYDSCVGFIDALPAVITTQGIWCLRQNLDTSASSGNIIDIQTNNVTIDCNGFRIRGSGGGASTAAEGIHATGRLNLAIRHCTIRGFARGIHLEAGSGYLVENNLVDQSRYVGIEISGAGSVVRRNTVVNSGGLPLSAEAFAIAAEGDVIDNVVVGVFGADSVTNFTANGIYSQSDPAVTFGIVIQGNRIRNLTPKGTGQAIGITSSGSGVAVRDNAIGQASSTTGRGVACLDNTSHVRDNVILNYVTGISVACHDAGGNSVD